MAERKTYARKKPNKLFISWSGPNSKEFAKELKHILEDVIFDGTDLTCFVSDVDIESGTDWWKKIKGELKTSKQSILCVTKENVKAPWIYYEAGAMVARDIPSIPLLISCGVESLEGSPLKGTQCVNFYDQQKFQKMIADINKRMDLLDITPRQLDQLSKEGYELIKADLANTLKNLRDLRIFNEKYVYPSGITTVKRNTVFISAPMASADDNEYAELRTYLLQLKSILKEIGFSDVVCPLFDKNSKSAFDGKTKAIKNNFADLKKVDSLIVIYPWKRPSSSLVEIGYGIALSKKMVIFHREGVPYILEEAGGTIAHVKTYTFDKLEEIGSIIEANGMYIFEGGLDE